MYKCTKCNQPYPSWEKKCYKCGGQIIDEVNSSYEKNTQGYVTTNLQELVEQNRKKEKKILAIMSIIVMVVSIAIIGGVATGKLDFPKAPKEEVATSEDDLQNLIDQATEAIEEEENLQINDLQKKLHAREGDVANHVDTEGLQTLLQVHFNKPIEQLTWEEIDAIKGLEIKVDYEEEWTLGYPNLNLIVTTLVEGEKITKVYPIAKATLGDMVHYGDFAIFHGLEALKVERVIDFPYNNVKSMKNLKILSIGSLEGKNEFDAAYDIEALGELTDVENLEQLTIKGDSITSLAGGEKFTKLHTLHMKNTVIQDFTVLNQMSNLKHLSIEDNEQMIPIEELAKLTQLESLTLKGDNILDVSSLETLVNLKKIYLEDTKVRDIHFMKGIPNLEHIELRNNYELSNVEVLATLPNLKELMIGGSDFSLPIIPSLTYFGVGGISDARAFEYMPNLEKLEIQGASISNGNVIAKIKKLKELTLVGGYISSDISSLFNHPTLEKLTIKEGTFALENTNKASSTSLQEISLIDTQLVYDFEVHSNGGITDMYYEDHLTDDVLNYLSGLKNLKTLTIRHMGLRDLAPITNLSGLETLIVSENEIYDIELLKNQSQLKAVDLSGNLITNIAPLLEMPNLQKARLSGLVFNGEEDLLALKEKCVVVSE